jgi:hypothetical protein
VAERILCTVNKAADARQDNTTLCVVRVIDDGEPVVVIPTPRRNGVAAVDRAEQAYADTH